MKFKHIVEKIHPDIDLPAEPDCSVAITRPDGIVEHWSRGLVARGNVLNPMWTRHDQELTWPDLVHHAMTIEGALSKDRRTHETGR